MVQSMLVREHCLHLKSLSLFHYSFHYSTHIVHWMSKWRWVREFGHCCWVYIGFALIIALWEQNKCTRNCLLWTIQVAAKYKLMIIGLLCVWSIAQMFILSLATSCWQMWQKHVVVTEKCVLLRHTAYSLWVYITLDILLTYSNAAENPAFDTTSITMFDKNCLINVSSNSFSWNKKALKKQEADFPSKRCLYWIIVLDWWSLALALAFPSVQDPAHVDMLYKDAWSIYLDVRPIQSVSHLACQGFRCPGKFVGSGWKNRTYDVVIYGRGWIWCDKLWWSLGVCGRVLAASIAIRRSVCIWMKDRKYRFTVCTDSKPLVLYYYFG